MVGRLNSMVTRGSNPHPADVGDAQGAPNHAGSLPGFHLMLQPLLG